MIYDNEYKMIFSMRATIKKKINGKDKEFRAFNRFLVDDIDVGFGLNVKNIFSRKCNAV